MSRMQIVGLVLLAIFLAGVAIGPRGHKTGELTDQQKLEIASDCIQHPKALRCQ